MGWKPRGDQSAFLLAVLFTSRRWLQRKLTPRHKAKAYADHMKDHLYCNTTKKDGNQLKEASVCWVLQDFWKACKSIHSA